MEVLDTAPADEVLLVLYRSGAKVVQDRIRAYHEKYLPLSQEVTDEQVIEAGGKPGTAKFEKVRRNLITALLNVRPKKIEPEPEPIPLVVASAGAIRSRNQPAPEIGMRVGLEFDVPRPLPDLDPIGLKRPDNILYSVSESDQGLVSRRMRGRVVKQLVFRPTFRHTGTYGALNAKIS